MTERLTLSVQEVADSLGVSRAAIYKAAERGQIPSLRVGVRVLIPRLWLEQQINESAAAVSDVLASTSHVSAPDSGTAGTTRPEPQVQQPDDRAVVESLSPGPAVQSHTKTGTAS